MESHVENKIHETNLILEIKPSLCVLSHERQFCEDEVWIHWYSKQARDVCLYQDGKEERLQCWTQQLKGVFKHQLKTRETVRYLLKQNGQVVAEQNIKVLEQFLPTKKRRRNRHPWSLF